MISNSYSPVAQSVERVAVNHHVRGSSPRWGAIKSGTYKVSCRCLFRYVSSDGLVGDEIALEYSQIFLPCNLPIPKLKIAGSNPVIKLP
jgi:hypothetical protein